MALVLAVEAGQGRGRVDVLALEAQGLWWGERREVRACGGARLIRAIGAVAVVVVQSRDGKCDRRVRDTSECLGVFVVLCNYSNNRQYSVVFLQLKLVLLDEHTLRAYTPRPGGL